MNNSDCLALRNVSLENARRKATLWELYNKVNKEVEVRTLCLMRNSEVVQGLLKETLNLLARKPGTCTKSCTKSKELVSRHVNKSPYHRTEQLKRKLSHLGQIVTMKC